MRRSTRVFNREPKSGAAATTATICCSLCCSLLAIAILNILSVVSIVIGAIYLSPENCPAQPNIAPVLLTSGILAIVLSIFEGRGRVKIASLDADGTKASQSPPRNCCDWFTGFLVFVNFVLFLYFCFIVYSLFPKVQYEPTSGTAINGDDFYCNPTLFLFSFWMVTIVLLTIGFALTIGLCCCCCVVSDFCCSSTA